MDRSTLVIWKLFKLQNEIRKDEHKSCLESEEVQTGANTTKLICLVELQNCREIKGRILKHNLRCSVGFQAFLNLHLLLGLRLGFNNLDGANLQMLTNFVPKIINCCIINYGKISFILLVPDCNCPTEHETEKHIFGACRSWNN